jgi:hypothetical protein
MRNHILILVFAIFLTSCIAGGRIIEISNSNKKIESLKLIQKVSGNSVDKTTDVSDRLNHPISTIYLLEIKKGEKASLLLDIQMQTSDKTDKPDSLMLMYLDGEKVEIAAFKDGTIQLKSHQFSVPENLWISIANSKQIQYRFNIGKEEIDIKLNPTETVKLKEFLLKAIQLRDANLPPVPEGLKKL